MPITPLDYESPDPERKPSDAHVHVLAVLAVVLPLVLVGAGVGVIAPMVGTIVSALGMIQGRRTGQKVVFGFTLYFNLIMAAFFVMRKL